ncbi:uncharacterized protein LOC110461216 isoform X1 [Mizuhopecten yessoensis]|uniref:uncharacterized protein LOC110461216 isoform X1 n=1 Tax=Mizuhopecten yessoensis TaxID=6573 RepID=UPI000B45F2E7|nr:uncharacterized protein LOC110461216 isoform X1 [Mizuhopecten yessoensis]
MDVPADRVSVSDRNTKLSEMLFKFITVILISYVAFHSVSGTVIDLLQLDDTTCPYEIHHLNEYSTYEVRWDGRILPYDCKMSFIGRDSTDASVSFQVCVKAQTFDVNDCDFKMKYFSGYNSVSAAREYSCYGGLPPMFCADEDEYLDLKFQVTDSSASSLTLIVTAEKKYEHQRVFLYVGVGLAVTACSVVFLLLFILYRKRQQQRSQGLIMQHTTPMIQSPTMYASAPLNQPYVQPVQGVHPAPPMVFQHSTPIPPPPYSESSTEEPKLPLSY